MVAITQEQNATPKMKEVVSHVGEEKVVISGMAGLYPKSRYIKDLENILYNKVNPVSSDELRWKYEHPEVPQYTGNIPDLDRFDAQFFKVPSRVGNYMDCVSRKLLEKTYEAIYDAGVNPAHLSGKKIGVYIGTCLSESEKTCFYVANTRNGLGIAGCSKTMFANRVSYWLNAKGPSMSIDEACCSSTAALEQAYLAISSGECEAAIVGGGNLCLHPQSSVHFGRLMNISMDGKTKSFAQDAAGCARSEAVNVLFLQKAKDALRIYAEVVHVKTEYVSILNGETGPKYGFNRDPANSIKFMNDFYKNIEVLPCEVEYVEAFGSAEPDADKSELEALDKVYCEGRKEPLLVGSVMSNIGYVEAASGISAVTKVLLGYHRGELAGNLHCGTPRSDIAALQEGRMRILMDHQSFQRTYVAVNGLSVTGINAHVLLHGHYKVKDSNRYKSNIPRLVTISGRQESSVKKILDQLKSQPVDPEAIALLQNIHESGIAGHLGRGYTILDSNEYNETVALMEGASYFDTAQRPLWFVYSGMGSQWAGMGAQLMRIPIFAAAIERCHRVLEPKGIDIVHIITSIDTNIFENILHSFVGIAAVQIGLTDVLRELGLVPDNIIGHSVGELGCAYADGCLTAEEMILSAYSRGLVSLETPFIRGSMAAVGMGFQQMSKMCPPDIEIACHNSADSCTISGPAEAMRIFVAELTAKDIFAKEVPCSNIAYHSRYIADAAPGLLKYLKEVVRTPRARSERWISSSVPQDRWDEPTAKYSSAEYHTNNLLSPVLFEEASKLIPSNAVLVEVAPHGLLQPILKRSLPSSCTNIALTQRGHPDNVLVILEAIGKLYMEGFYPKIQVLYPKVEFPVSTGTPFLSNLVEWTYEEKWYVPLFQNANRVHAASCKFLVSIYDDEYSCFKGHVIRNKTLVPFSFALVAAWDTLAMLLNVEKKSIDVQFHDVQLHAQPVLTDQRIVRLTVSLHRGTGQFEIMNESSKVVTGLIKSEEKKTETNKFVENEFVAREFYELYAPDVYRLLYEREYSYSGEFRSIYNANKTLTEANILWNGNWVTFIDGLIQLNILSQTRSGVWLPDRIRKMSIDVNAHLNSTKMNKSNLENETIVLKAEVSEVQDRSRCGGVTIENMQFHDLLPAKLEHEEITLQSLKFVPRFNAQFSVETSLSVLLQIVGENINKDIINILGLKSANDDDPLFREIVKISEDHIVPGLKIKYTQLNKTMPKYDKYDLLLVKNISSIKNISQTFYKLLPLNTYIINKEDNTEEFSRPPSKLYNVVSKIKNTASTLELAVWRSAPESGAKSSVFSVHTKSDLPYLTDVRNSLISKDRLIVLSSDPPVPGLLSTIKKWRKEPTRNNIYLVMDNNSDDPSFEDLSESNLAINVVHNRICGGEYYLPSSYNTSAVGKNIILQSTEIGNLNSLHWVQVPEPDGNGVKVTVHYAGLNVEDVKRALGVKTSMNDNQYAMEYSGVTQRGEKVMGLVLKGAARSHILASPDLMWPVPAYWSLEDAATVPLAYFCAYYCLVVKASSAICDSGSQVSVLVNGGAGALGQAMICVALAKGYRVFATVSDLHKKRFLLKLFPQLKEEDIGNSRDESFGDLVLEATNGEGCQFVICCLKRELKNISMKCCGLSGIMFDTTQIPNHENYSFGMYNLTKARSYVAVDISSFIKNASPEELKVVMLLVSEGIALGHVRPLSRVTYAPHEVPRAFRLLAASRHRGRVLLRMRDPLPSPEPRFLSPEGSCHVVFCDEQPLSLQLVDKLIDRGVKKLHLYFHTLPSYLDYKLRLWKNSDIQVTVSCGELNDPNGITVILQNASHLGPVEGIHITGGNMLKKTVFKFLYLVSQIYCPSIKFFLVLNNDSDCEYKNIVQAANNGVPVIFLDLSMLETFQDEDGFTWYRGGVEAAEQALRSPEQYLTAVPKHSPCRSLVQQIATLAELKITEKTPNNASLIELGLALEKSEAICTLLTDIYNTSLDVQDIPLLTVEKINQIENKSLEMKTEEIKGLRAFYSYVDPDELLATTEMVFLPTLANSSTLRGDEFNMHETFLCIVPGLEGHHARFRTLCERLKLPALVLQPGLDQPEETLQELAVRYSKVILKMAVQKSTFYILGYETGVAVALEVAAILETYGQTGTVFCLGDGPEETKALLESELRAFETEEALQTGIARHMCSLMAQDSAPPAMSVLHSCSSWRERVDECVRSLLGRMSHTAQYAHALLEAAYARIGTARRYSATPRALRSRLVLLRARSALCVKVECSLQRYSLNPLVVHELAASMSYLAADLRLPAIINSHLEDEILRAFDKKNLCDTYLTNAEGFMATE